MFDAQLLMVNSDGGAVEVFGPWMGREATNAIFTLDLVESDGVTLQVQIYTKNSEDTGDGAVVTSTDINTATIGQTNAIWLSTSSNGFDELVRYKFTIAEGEEANWVLFRMLPPSWFDTAKT